MGMISSFLHPGKGYDKAQKQLDKYYQQAQMFQQPYMQHGQEQYSNLNNMLASLMDPTELNKKWIESYSESPQALQDERLAQEHGLNAASSMGLLGSNTALNALQSGTTQIGLNDRQNYLDDLMKKYMAAAGLAQGIYGTGANAASGMGQNAMNMGQNSAQMAYNKQNASGNMLSGLVGQGIGLVGSALGGPIGGALGKSWNLTGGV